MRQPEQRRPEHRPRTTASAPLALPRARVEQRRETLTNREREVFALVTTGMLILTRTANSEEPGCIVMDDKEVAWQLGVSEKTVKVHRARVMEKMRASSLADLVRMADRIGVPMPAASEAHEPDEHDVLRFVALERRIADHGRHPLVALQPAGS